MKTEVRAFAAIVGTSAGLVGAKRPLSHRLAFALGIAFVLTGCAPEQSRCAPVDPGGECFAPSKEAFIEHALTSAMAWPQLDGVTVSANRVIEAVDTSTDSRTWLVPLMDGNRMVAISRFLTVGEDEVKLGEVSLLEEPLEPLPERFAGELVLFADASCAEDPSIDCLFSEERWAVALPNGTFQLPDGSVVEELPGQTD